MIEILEPEVSLINSIGLQQMTRVVLRAIEDHPVHGPYFFLNPAARNKGHHPECDRRSGGFIQHVKRAVLCGRHVCRSFQLSQDSTDIVTAALILHDICRKNYQTHAGDAAMFIDLLQISQDLLHEN